MAVFPQFQGGGLGGHRRGTRPGVGVGVLMTSLLLTLLTALFPSPASGASAESIQCHFGRTEFTNRSSCGTSSGKNYELCCTFIFSFGEVESAWACTSSTSGNLNLCAGEDNSCVKYENDPSEKSVRCACTAPLCNTPTHWAKDPIFKQWKNHPENGEWSGGEEEGTTPNPQNGKGGVARSGGRGDLATVVSALLVISLTRHFSVSVSAPYVILTLGATFLLLLPSTVSGDEGENKNKARNLTCLSSSNATDDWGDRHCGEEIETCCYYIFRETPSWDCSSQNVCEFDRGWGNEPKRVCREQWDGVGRKKALLCTCATTACNHPGGWEADPTFLEWKEPRTTTPRTQKDYGNGYGGRSGRSGPLEGTVSFFLVLKGIFGIIL